MIGPIPFAVPSQYAAALSSGTLVRAGALLKDSGTGQIVAHLQETGLAQKLLSSAISSPFSPLEVLNVPSNLAANVQISQLKTMVEGLQVLQFSNLGATVAGIGISAIGFTLMNQKLNAMQTQISALSDRIEAHFKELREREFRARFAKLHGLFEQADQAHSLTTRSTEWQRIAGALADESSYFKFEIDYLIKQDVFDLDLFTALSRSFALCNAGRIECYILSNELSAALRVSADVAKSYNSLFDEISPLELAKQSASLKKNDKEPFNELMDHELPKMQTLVNGLRDTQDAALSKPYLLETLIEKEIDGYQYMQTLREEREQPIYLLPAS